MPLRIPEANRVPNALLERLPQNRMAVRSPISSRLYHLEIRNNAPGKNAASTRYVSDKGTAAVKKTHFDETQKEPS